MFYVSCGHAITTENLFHCYRNKLHLTKDQRRNNPRYANLSRTMICVSVFVYALKLVIDDIIKRGVRFRLPISKSKHGYLMVGTISGNVFKNARSKGCFLNVDFLKSNFKAHFVALEFKSNGLIRRKRIYVDSGHRDELTNNTNNGREYF